MNNIVMIKHINLMLSWLEDSIEFARENKDLKLIKTQLVRTQRNLKKTRDNLMELYNVSI